MNRLALFGFFVVGASVLISFGSVANVNAAAIAADKKVNTEKKRDVNPSEMDEILADDNKKKRSQEVIMFGNQQNKPAGMVDDVLVGFADKKSFKRDHLSRDDDLEEIDDSASDNPDDGDDKGVFDSVAPSIGLDKINESRLAMDARGPDSSEVAESSDDEDQNAGGSPFLPGDYLRSQTPYQEMDDPQSQPPSDPNYVSQDWSEFGNRFYNGDLYRRRRRNAAAERAGSHHHNNRKRSLVTPIDQLMHLRSGGRWKRDLKLRDDDVVGLLGLLAAAEVAKERQEERHRQLEELETAYANAMIEPETQRRLEFEPDDQDMVADNYVYYNGPEYDPTIIDDDVSSPDELPNVVLYEPETAIELQRRSGHFYPNVDYRSLGVIGQRKRSMSPDFNPRRTSYGVWGRLEERKRYPLSASFDELLTVGPEVDEGEDELVVDDLDGGRGGQFERTENKLYSLGELLKSNDAADDNNYPVYRRLI